jgi:hypothetical protein
MIILLALIGLSGNSMAEWTAVGTSDDGVNYANLAMIRRNGDMAKMWVLTDFKTARQTEQYRYLSHESQNEYNCMEEQFREVFFTIYSSNMASGEQVYSSSNQIGWAPVRPGSIGETEFKIACGITK